MSALRFDGFELNLASGELHENGTAIRLQPQPLKVLMLLASRAGQLVSREEIQKQVWPDDTFVNFDQGLNYCIRQIRAALGDDAEAPRIIETVPRRGYRFLAAVEIAPPAERRVMLVVLPFRNLSGDQEQEYVSDGLTEEVIAQLGRLNPDRLGVIARTSAMRYKHTDKSIGMIGRELLVLHRSTVPDPRPGDEPFEESLKLKENGVAMKIASFLLLCGLTLFRTNLAAAGPLRAGAARIDITPPVDAALPMAGYGGRTQGFKGIHDRIYVRAIVLDDGATQAAIVAWESLFVPDAVWMTTSKRIADETGIRLEHLLLSAVHDHGAPTLAPNDPTPQQIAYRTSLENAAVEAVRRARAQLQPARFGIGTSQAYVNVNRREFSPGRGWWLGYNDDGPSDKTVTVLRFDDIAGKPIAFWINYPVHAVVMGPENYQITGDIAGATSRFVEQHYLGNDRPRSDMGMRLRLRPEEKGTGDGAIALWTSGAAGDQNPVSMTNGEDFTLVDGLGKILGEAAVRAASNITTSAEARLRGAQKVVTCPGRRVEAGPTPRAEYKFNDADPVDIRLSLLTINDVALAGVSGEVFTLIAQRLRHESPAPHTVMVTHTNGSSGYIPNDAAFEPVSYEVTASRLKPGCAEGAIVNGLLDLIGKR